MSDQADQWLWLFSSNRRALYAQDVSNVAGLPSGAHYQFRYRERWLGARASSEWSQLPGKTAVIVFSFQHVAHIHPPAFIPIRLVKVLSCTIEGSFRLVTFEIGRNISLQPYSQSADHDLPSMGARCQKFSRELERVLSEEGHPGGRPDRSAVLGPALPQFFDAEVESAGAWERTVDYLAAVGSYPDHLFLRFVGIGAVGEPSQLTPTDGRYGLQSGKTYELELFHYRPQPSDHIRSVILVADRDLIEIQGPDVLPVSSGYDRLLVRFTPSMSDDTRFTTFTIEPPTGESGTTIRTDLRIDPAKRDKVVRAGLGGLAILCAAIPGLVSGLSGGLLAGMLVVVGAGAAASGFLAVRSRTRPPRT
jgi:hypothetical protein